MEKPPAHLGSGTWARFVLALPIWPEFTLISKNGR